MKTTFDNLGGRDGRAERAAIKGDFLKLKTKKNEVCSNIFFVLDTFKAQTRT